jgi:hypothetical protein
MNIPTFTELYQSILTDLKNKLSITYIIGKVVVNAFAAVQAAKLKILYIAASNIYKNIFVDTADPERLGGSLERYGLVKLGRQPNPAVAGEYKMSVTGVIGAVIPANTSFKSLEGALNPDKLFVIDSDYTFTSTSGIINIRALDLGANSALNAGDELQVTAPIADVESYGFITEVVVIATNEESSENYRQAIINSYQLEAQGGAKTDYKLWAQDATGVRDVYPYAKSGYAGEINLWVEATVEDSTDGKGTPSSALLSDVEDVINFDPDASRPIYERGRLPLGVFDVHYLPINLLAVDVYIENLSDITLINSIEIALINFIYDVRPYIAGAENPNNEQKDRLYLSDIINVIRDVIGSSNTFTSVEMTVDGSLETIYQFINGNIPYIDNIIQGVYTP